MRGGEVQKIFDTLRRLSANTTPQPTAAGNEGGIAIQKKLKNLLIIVL